MLEVRNFQCSPIFNCTDDEVTAINLLYHFKERVLNAGTEVAAICLRSSIDFHSEGKVMKDTLQRGNQQKTNLNRKKKT